MKIQKQQQKSWFTMWRLNLLSDFTWQARYLPGVDFEALFEELDMPGFPAVQWCRLMSKSMKQLHFLVIPNSVSSWESLAGTAWLPWFSWHFEASLLLKAAHFQHPSHLQGAGWHTCPTALDWKTRADRWITGMFTSTEGLVDELVADSMFGPHFKAIFH